MTAALPDRVWELAGDVGRLRRRVEPGSSLAYLADRLAGHVCAIDSMLRPSAAQIAAMWAPGDEEAIEEAILLVDRHAAEFFRRMGGRP